ncbi:hypothetical protein V8G54_015696 [Vigna mungo]|uniref:Uncharacterized protein n=1 Tax=Vigna mungo TaxID=3915 RepID=A0AAQ3NLR2_VIGMU
MDGSITCLKCISENASLSELLISAAIVGDPSAVKDLAVPSHIHTTSVHSFIHSPSELTLYRNIKNDSSILRLAYLSQFQISVVVLIAANTANIRKPPTCVQMFRVSLCHAKMLHKASFTGHSER